MIIKEGIGWKACRNEEKNVYGAEVVFQGSFDCYEITGSVFGQLNSKMSCGEAEKLIRTGRHIYAHVNDRFGPPYTIVFDDDYTEYCQWMKEPEKPDPGTWSAEMTDAAVEVFESEKANREQRRKKRASRLNKKK
ncbi:MAG: hypothetical protein IJK33_06100 [Clostridia bacterium]|nr:hypothetical protein [Clostridia bacterium]